MDLTLKQFYDFPVYNYFLRVISHDVVVFNEDMNSDLIEDYIIPLYGNHKIQSIECFSGDRCHDGTILEIKLKG